MKYITETIVSSNSQKLYKVNDITDDIMHLVARRMCPKSPWDFTKDIWNKHLYSSVYSNPFSRISVTFPHIKVYTDYQPKNNIRYRIIAGVTEKRYRIEEGIFLASL